MAIIPLQLARVSNSLRTSVATQTLARTQRSLLTVQNQLATGRRLATPSDAPGDAAIIQQLRKTLEQRGAYLQNIKQAGSQLSEAESTLGDVTSLLQQAQSLASANVGTDVTQSQRDGAAEVVKSIYAQMLSFANKQFQGSYLFGGTLSNQAPFVESGGGVKFVGSRAVLENRFDESTVLPFSVGADEVFGALSNRVQGSADLSPAIAPATRLADLRGASGDGIRKGLIQLSDGTTTALVDLTHADTVQDVLNAVNGAGVAGVTAAIAPDGVSLQLLAGPGANLSVNEVGGGRTASDLGILQPVGTGPGMAIDGADVKARVTNLTPLASLRGGAGFDRTSGITITNGLLSATVSFASANTVQDMLNAINGAGVGVRAEINEAGTGINVLNVTEATDMRIAENGGATATHLGIRSYSPASRLSELNYGQGVRTVTGPDLRITRTDGVGFDVDLSNLTTVQDVIDAINAAAAGAGGGVTAGFTATGNGIRIADTAGGVGTLTLSAVNFSNAAADLGLNVPAVGNSITTADVSPVRAAGVFTNLARLRDALLGGDDAAITQAAEALKADQDRIVRVRGIAGARVQEMEARETRMEDQNVATQKLLADMEEIDYTEAIARFQSLQTSFEASLRSAGQVLNLSLLDFLG